MKQLFFVAVLVFSQVSYAEQFSNPPPDVAKAGPAEQLVQTVLLQPLAKKDDKQSRFSRARLPPRERQVRVIDTSPLRDSRGRTFVRFAVDERRGLSNKDWNRGTITGCAYVDRKEVFVKKGDQFRPADFLLGKYRKAAADSTCKGEPTLAHARS